MTTNYKNEEKRQALRYLLIHRIDAVLDANEPDMETVDLYSSLLGALEGGECQPRGTRMRRALSRLADEIAYIPQKNSMEQIRSVSVRKILIGVAAVCVCLFLLPISVMLIRTGLTGSVGHAPLGAETAGTETAAITEAFSGVVFSRGDTEVRYDDLAACLGAELPDIYYPTEFPEGVQPTAVAVTEEEDGTHVEIGFGDAPYSISVYPCPTDWRDTPPYDGCEISNMHVIAGGSVHMDAYEITDEDGYYLAVSINNNVNEATDVLDIYEFRGADAAAVHDMFRSMSRADTDHIHTWVHEMIPAKKLEDGTTEYKIRRYCMICSSEPSDSELAQKKDEKIAQQDELIAKLDEAIAEKEEMKQSLVDALEAAVADRDKTNNEKDISFMESKISELEKELQALNQELQTAIAERKLLLSQNAS